MRPLIDTTPLEALHDQLRMFSRIQPGSEDGWPFRDIHDLLLKRGAVYRAQAHNFPVYPRACFDEAYRRATRRGSKWIYVEGYAIKPEVPLAVLHAWVAPVDQPDVAVDSAWGYQPDAAYLGIAFDAAYVRRMHKLSGQRFYSVLDAWWAGNPLVTGEHRLDEVTWKPK